MALHVLPDLKKENTHAMALHVVFYHYITNMHTSHEASALELSCTESLAIAWWPVAFRAAT